MHIYFSSCLFFGWLYKISEVSRSEVPGLRRKSYLRCRILNSQSEFHWRIGSAAPSPSSSGGRRVFVAFGNCFAGAYLTSVPQREKLLSVFLYFIFCAFWFLRDRAHSAGFRSQIDGAKIQEAQWSDLETRPSPSPPGKGKKSVADGNRHSHNHTHIGGQTVRVIALKIWYEIYTSKTKQT